MSNKNKLKVFSKVTFSLARKVPFLFPKWLSYLAREDSAGTKAENLSYKSVSMFEGDFIWKGITVSLRMTHQEKLSVFKWVSKHNPSSSHWQAASQEDFNINSGYSSSSLGVIGINDSRVIPELKTIYVDGDFFSSVYISVVDLASGFCILTFYFNLKSTAVDKIKEVSIKNLEPYSSLPGYNIFSKINRYTIHYDVISQAEDIVTNAFNEVVASAKEISSFLLKQMRCKPKGLITTSDFYIDQDKSYFDLSNRSVSSDEDKKISLITPWADFSDMNYSLSSFEHFIDVDRFKSLDSDYIYLLCKKSDTFSQFNNFLNRYYSNNDGHMVFIAPNVLRLELSLIARDLNFINNRANKISLYHDRLFSFVSSMEEMNSWMGSYKRSNMFMVNPTYQPMLQALVNGLEVKVKENLELSKRLYAHSKNRVEVSNIRYTQLNSIFVTVLIISQLILAAMTIDWSDTGKWYYPLIAFFKSTL